MTSNAVDKECTAALRLNVMIHVLRRLSSGAYPIKDTAAAAIATFSVSIQHLSFKQTVAVITKLLDMFDNWEKIEGDTCVSLLKLLPNALATADIAEQAHGLDDEGAHKSRSVVVFVHCCRCVRLSEIVGFAGSENICSSSDLQETIVTRVLQKAWPKGSIAELVELMRDLKM